MPLLDGMEAAKKMRVLHHRGKIDLSETKIFMHSAIQNTLQWKGVFDGKCNDLYFFGFLFINFFIVNKPVNF